MKQWSIVLAAVCLTFASTAAAKITWVGRPVFKKSGPPPARTTFVVHGRVDVSEMQHDLAAAFDDDAAAGQAYFLTALTECLSGARVLGEPQHGILRDERHRLGWAALPSTVPPDTGTWGISWTESTKTASPVLDGADSLSAALARKGADWLVVIDELVATLESGQSPQPGFTPRGEWQMQPGKLPVANLAARVVVLGGHPAVIVGSGHVSARRTIGRFRKSSVDGIAESFTLQLERALGKR